MFISLVVAWSYYAYVFAVVVQAMASSPVEQVTCAIIFHCLAVMFLWSYYMIIFTPPGVVPTSWCLDNAQVSALAAAKSEGEWKTMLATFATDHECQVKQRSVQGAIRYCEKCRCIKPDRSHHCSVCEDCTLKMDHHCPWVNNCVGFHNYKFFLLFLGYALIYCIWIAATTARFFILVWIYRVEEGGEEEEDSLGAARYHLLSVFFVSILFSISVSSLFWYHLWLLVHNRSTLEQFRAPVFENSISDADGWSLGKLNNVREVLGESSMLWILPLKSGLGDGIAFPTRLPLDFSDYSTIPRRSITSLGGTETPSRTLINPVLGKDGKEVVMTQHSCQSTLVTTSPDCRLTITPDSGVGVTEVRLDLNGHAQTVIVCDHDSQGGGGCR